MGRLKQLFIAPGPEDDELPIAPSAWHDGPYVTIPMEHWEVILDFAEKLDSEKTQRLRDYSYPTDRCVLPHAEEHEVMMKFIRYLQGELLGAPPLVPEPNALFPENFPNEDHAQMLEAVAAVLVEAQRLGLPFVGDTN
jgi:hypothetical protein